MIPVSASCYVQPQRDPIAKTIKNIRPYMHHPPSATGMGWSPLLELKTGKATQHIGSQKKAAAAKTTAALFTKKYIQLYSGFRYPSTEAHNNLYKIYIFGYNVVA